MRELGFRAWSIKKRRFLNIDTLYCANGKVCAVVEDGVVYDIEDVILEQYTGVKDKNDKEVYEGDVVKMPRELCLNHKGVGVVEFWRANFHIKDQQFSNGTRHIVDFYDYNNPTKDFEVIGNIHENPELLESVL